MRALTHPEARREAKVVVAMALPIRRGNRFPASLTESRHMMDPFREFEEMWDRIGRQFMSPIFDRYLETGGEQQANSWTPLIEVEETDEAYLVKAELPGLKREDIDLQVDEHTLSIAGEVRPEQHEKGQVLQRRSGRFFYRTALPRDVETDNVKAQMREGVLNIRIPKT